MAKIGVIVGRFQTDDIHRGQSQLIDAALDENDQVLIIIGTSPTRLTYTNPLSFESRREMILDYISSSRVQIIKLMDCKYDDVWSMNLDSIIKNHMQSKDQITLYGGRDSFSKYYTGIFKVKQLTFGIDHISASEIRKEIHSDIDLTTEDWRRGVIYASEYRFPVSYQAVDVAIINFDKKELLLGKKEGEKGYRFIGGFVDPEDKSLEHAAKREAKEECGDIETDDYRYIGSFRVDDWRYRKEKDKIMSALFCCHYIYGRVVANDDISELKWFPISDFDQILMEPEHSPLLIALHEYLVKFKI